MSPSIFWFTTVPLLLILGALGYRLILGFSLWRVHREPAHAWAALWCATAILFIAGRFAQRVGYESYETVFAAVLLQYAGIVTLMPATLLVAHAIAGQSPTRHELRRMVIATTLALGGLGAALVSAAHRGITEGVDAMGEPLRTIRIGPAIVVLLPFVVWVAVESVRILRIGESRRAMSWGLAAVGGLLALFGFNDALMAAGLVRSVQVAHFGVAVALMVGGYALTSRVSLRQRRLDETLAAHSRELERALEEVRQGEARFRVLADAAIEGIVVHEGGRIRDSNGATSRMTLVDSVTLRARDVVTLFDEKSAPAIRSLIGGSVHHPVRVHGRRADGSLFSAEVKASHAPPGRGHLGVLAIVDTSERDEMNRRLIVADRMASLGTLAAGAAHEINNPLAYVRLNLDQLEEELAEAQLGDIVTPALKELLPLIAETRQGCERIGRVVGDLRTLSRQDDSHRDANRPVDMRRVAQSAVKMAQHEIRYRARLVDEYEDGTCVEGDEARLTQVCLNLLINAVHALPVGHVSENEIRVSVRREGKSVVLEVADTGSGIAPDVLPRIFDPFFTTKPTGVGTGLGLSICHTIVTSEGGDISVESRVGAGTIFRVTLPASDAVPSSRSEHRRSLPNAEVGAVLIVDDEIVLARSLARALRGCDVTVATTGKYALAEVERRAFDLVLCDLTMPDTSGVEVYEHLKRVRPDLASRFVLMTGGAISDDAKFALGDAAGRVLYKPIDIETLRRTVDRMLGSGITP